MKVPVSGDDGSSVEQLNMTPMIDCIFQLLIFFMCATHFKSLEGKLMSYLPKDKGLMSSPVTILPLELRIRVQFDETNYITRYLIAEKEVFSSTDTANEKSTKLADTIKDLYGKLSAKAPKDQKVPVKVEANANVPFQDIVFVLDQCQKNNISNVEYAAVPLAPKK